jgi:hypothetical protein
MYLSAQLQESTDGPTLHYLDGFGSIGIAPHARTDRGFATRGKRLECSFFTGNGSR